MVMRAERVACVLLAAIAGSENTVSSAPSAMSVLAMGLPASPVADQTGTRDSELHLCGAFMIYLY